MKASAAAAGHSRKPDSHQDAHNDSDSPGHLDGRHAASVTARVRLALLPRFTAEVVVLDEASVVNLYRPCDIDGCLRVPRFHGLCMTHGDRWRRRGRPDLARFHDDPDPSTRPEQIRLGSVPSMLRAEVGLALQLACTLPWQPPRARLVPSDIQRLVGTLQRRHVTTLLDDEEVGSKLIPASLSKPERGVLTTLRRLLEDFLDPPDPTTEFDPDVWRLSLVGPRGGGSRAGQNGRLRFDRIPQQWLRHLVKRFMRWRIATGVSFHQLNRDITALQRLADAFTDSSGPRAAVDAFTRETIETYLAHLVRSGLAESSRSYDISSVATFLRVVRQHDWQPGLSPTVGVYPGDHPRRPVPLPRALPEFVMAQIERDEALAQLPQPHQLMMRILIGAGLRLSDAYRLRIDCLVRDGQGAPYLRYHNHKMKRDAIVPVDDHLAGAITDQAANVINRLPEATRLAPAPRSLDGHRTWWV